MAGFRTFATGEVLTAANVNDFLMGQSVMRFADADARTAALGADVVEGMLTYNLDTDQLEVFDGTNFVVAAPEPPAGIGSNVVSTVKTNQFVLSTGTPTAVPGLSVTITPSSATSRVLIIARVVLGVPTGTGGNFVRLTGGNAGDYVGDASGSRSRVWAGQDLGSVGAAGIGSSSAVFLDNPATTSPVTYGVEMFVTSGTGKLNSSRDDSDSNRFPRTASSIVAIEVAA